MSDNWIIIKRKCKGKRKSSEIRIDKDGKVFLNGELFDEKNPKLRNYHIDIEEHGRINTGEETRKMIESQGKSKKGDRVVLKDIRDKEKTETTIVKY